MFGARLAILALLVAAVGAQELCSLETASASCGGRGGCVWCDTVPGLGFCWHGGQCPLAAAQAQVRDQFADFKQQHNPTYKDVVEEEHRFGVFSAALERIASYNADPQDGAEYGVTRWADRTFQELRRRCGSRRVNNMTGLRGARAPRRHVWDGTCYVKARFPEQCAYNSLPTELAYKSLPTELDWTKKGAVTNAKDQGGCGNCYTFGATCDMEAAWFLAGNDLVSLSEQQLTSCDRVGGETGCGGDFSGLDTDSYVSVHGLNSEKAYPYSRVTKVNGTAGVCNKALEAKPVAKFTKGYQISGGDGPDNCAWCTKQPVDEKLMVKHIVVAGPISIAINSKYIDAYSKGIMSPRKCPGKFDDLDHQVAIVGYGTENGVDYWKIKNSWGPDWGEHGFFRIVRGDNRCGVAADASHVVAAAAAATDTVADAILV